MARRGDTSLAAVLLTQRLVDAAAEELRAREYWTVLARVADPGRLLGRSVDELTADLGDRALAARVAARFDAATALAFELERLEQAGIRVIASVDADYPARLRHRLGTGAPPLLHAVGPFGLLDGPALAILADSTRDRRSGGAAADADGSADGAADAGGGDAVAAVAADAGGGDAVAAVAADAAGGDAVDAVDAVAADAAGGDAVDAVDADAADAGGGDAVAAVAADAARCAVERGWSVVGGAAPGVMGGGADAVAARAALDAGGSAVGILAGGLAAAVRDPEVRSAVGGQRLCLVTPYPPGAGVTAARAAGRVRLIPAACDATLVVDAGSEEGDTWRGAVEAFDRAQGPVAVWTGTGIGAGNRALAARGVRAVDDVARLWDESAPGR